MACREWVMPDDKRQAWRIVQGFPYSALLLIPLLAVLCGTLSLTFAQSSDTCTAQILNRTASLDPDGTFTIDNIPSAQGFGRVRIVCSDGTNVLGGVSDFLQIIPGDTVDVGAVPLDVIPPRVKALAVTVTPTELNTPGATAQLTVLATLSDESTRDVTNAADGTTYTSSNPAIGTVSPDGLVTVGERSGTLIVSVMNDGVFASKRLTVTLTNDNDSDGLPNDFETANTCLQPAVPDGNADPDGDGLTNLEEFTRGTSPCVADTDGDGLNDAQELTHGTNPVLADTDSDGLLDGDEVARGSNPLNPDSDGDGLPDGVEVTICSTPFCANPNVDNDGDSLLNIDEIQLGTNPANPDTDFDGLNDGAEVLAQTNPLNRDTDGDGFPDGFEVEARTNPLDANSRPSFPNPPPPGEAVGVIFSVLNRLNPSQDSDQDGVSDLIEVSAGTDPFDPTSRPMLPPSVREAVGALFSILNRFNPAQDSDRDGVSDLVEVSAGTDPFDPASVPNIPRLMLEAVGAPFSILNMPGLQQLAQGLTALFAGLQDSDGDGIPDAFETAHGLNPNDPTDATADPDGDGLTNYDEFHHGTDPHRADTDGDRIPDGQEVRAGTDPLNPDTTPPTVVVAQPAEGALLLEGQTISIHVEATDNTAVSSVHVVVNGAAFPVEPATLAALTFTVPPQADTLTVSAAARDVAGNVGTSPEVTAFVTPDPLTTVRGRVVDAAGNPVAGAAVVVHLNGLRGEFFALEAPVTSLPVLSALTPTATRLVSAINFRNPHNLLQAEAFGEELGPHFAARFTGLLRVAIAGTYTVMLGADDRARLVIDGTVVVDIPATGAFTEASASLQLPAGHLPILIEYFRESGMAELQLSYVPPDGERQIVLPDAVLQDPPAFTTLTAADGTFVVAGVPTVLGDVWVQATFTNTHGVRFAHTSVTVPPVPAGVTDVGILELLRE